MKLKVCGITTLEQLQQLHDLEVDYAGLIFYEKSKRYAHERLLPKAAAIRELVIKKVGVFVNADMDFLKSLIDTYALDAVQLHGDETPSYCAELKGIVKVIKVFRINETTKDIDALIAPFQEICDYVLFDTDTAGYGGSGKRFDWTLLEEATIGKPFFLSGGIGPEDIEHLKSFQHPWLYAVDVNSRFEVQPGIKDMALVKPLVNNLKQPLYG